MTPRSTTEREQAEIAALAHLSTTDATPPSRLHASAFHRALQRMRHPHEDQMTATAEIEITEEIAHKVLATVDAGLVRGRGNPIPGQMCVEAAVCYAMGLPHSDEPTCVSQALRSLKISLNDTVWSSSQARAAGMRRLALAQLGSKGALDDKDFVERCIHLVIGKYVPKANRSAAYDVDVYASYATSCATDAQYVSAASYAVDAVVTTTYAARYAGNVAIGAKDRDAVLSEFAEDVVQILIQMGAPGCQWLWMTEAPAAA